MTLDLEAIKARADAATEGPWSARELPQMVRGAFATLHSAHGTGEVWSTEFQPEIGSTVSTSDAEFIATSRQDIPALIAEVERLRGVVEEVKAFCSDPCTENCCEACNGQNEAYRQVLTILDALEGP